MTQYPIHFAFGSGYRYSVSGETAHQLELRAAPEVGFDTNDGEWTHRHRIALEGNFLLDERGPGGGAHLRYSFLTGPGPIAFGPQVALGGMVLPGSRENAVSGVSLRGGVRVGVERSDRADLPIAGATLSLEGGAVVGRSVEASFGARLDLDF